MDITLILNALMTLFAALITVFLVPCLKTKLTAQQRKELLELAKIAVEAAQQIYGQYDGKFRKAQAMDFLNTCGYDMSMPIVDQAIESAVLEMQRESKKDIPKPIPIAQS